MNFRLTAILFGTLFVLGVVLLVVSFTGDNSPAGDSLTEELVGLKAEDIDTVEFEREGGSKLKIVRVDKEGNRWNITEPYTARADAAAVMELIGALLKAKPTTHPELSSNPAVHGLQPAGLRVTLSAGEKSSTINLGEATSGARGVVFVTTSARPKRPMAVLRTSIEPLFREAGKAGKAVDLAKWVNDYRAKSVFPVDTRGIGDDVSRITLTHGKNVLSLERGAGAWKFVTPAGWGNADPLGDVTAAPGTFTGVNKLVGSLTNLQAITADDFVAEPKPEDLERDGVNDNSPGVIKVEIKNKEGETTTAFIGRKDASAAPAPTPGMQESGKYWVRVVGQPGVIRATAADLGGLAAVIDNPDPLRDRNLLDIDRNRIDGIDLANGATKLRKIATNVRNPWRLYGKPEFGDPQSAVGVDLIINTFTEHRTVKSFPPPNPANFAPAELKGTVKLWVDGFEVPKDPKAEPKEKGKPVVLEFGKKEADGTINVRRTLADGTQAYFLMPEKFKLPTTVEPVDLLATANKSRLDLLDHSLKGFATTIASRLSVSGTVNFELVKDEKPDPYTRGPRWRFVKPDNQKGQTADPTVVADMLAGLANTNTATRLVDENPDPAKLAEYGLGPVPGRKGMPGDPPVPRLRVVVGIKDTVDPADKERVYEFGNTFPGDASQVYARQAGRSVVFTLPKVLMDKFSADLRDKSLFHFDPANVTTIEFKGWSKTGFQVELNFGKNKEGMWVVTKSPGAYNLEPVKVEAFLRTLAATRVKAFIPGDRKREQGLFEDGQPDQKDNLSILVRIKDDPGIHIILGNPTDGGASYFGWTSRTQPHQVFTVDAATFKQYREGPGAFAK
ncbi:MAG TPA: DUF4340 domain-containing protein [Gemmata sp.]|nr:DUF4340 domain-containing protein [Gemmata sp.]